MIMLTQHCENCTNFFMTSPKNSSKLLKSLQKAFKKHEKKSVGEHGKNDLLFQH